MKQLTFFFLVFFTLSLIGMRIGAVASGQDDHVAAQHSDKRAELIPPTDAPWGLAIEFAPGTTLPKAIDLKQRYGLQFAVGGWNYADVTTTLSYSATFTFDPSDYGKDDGAHYFGQVRYWHEDAYTGCWNTQTCPPVFVTGAIFEPVASATEQALLAEPLVARLDNRRETTFFFLKILECWIEKVQFPTAQCRIITPWE